MSGYAKNEDKQFYVQATQSLICLSGLNGAKPKCNVLNAT